MSVDLKSFSAQLRALKNEGLSEEAALVFMQMQFQYHQDSKLRERIQRGHRMIELLLEKEVLPALERLEKPATIVSPPLPYPTRAHFE